MPDGLLTVEPDLVRANGPWLWPLGMAGEDSTPLETSLRDMGQCTPLLVARKDGELLLVDGCKRLEALAGLGRKVLILLVEAPGDEDKALLRLAANQAWRLGAAEPARLVAVLRFFLQRLERPQVEEVLPPRVGLEARSRTWRQLLQWCGVFATDSPWERHLLQGRLPLACVEALSRMDEQAREALEPFFRELAWSASGARQFVTLMYETAKGQGRDIGDVLQSSGIPGILEAGLSPKDTMARILEAARAARFPHKTALEGAFARLGKELTAGTPWCVQPEQQFEADAVYLSTRIRSREEARKATEHLTAMAESGLWAELLDVARD